MTGIEQVPQTVQKGMTVNFNNLRLQVCNSYDNLVETLNGAILKNDQYAIPNDVRHGQEININGYVLVDAEQIQRDLEDLRMLIGTIACLVEEGNDDIVCVLPEGGLKSFNDENE